jgi:uncharacterized membrane protein HdeD (DUF308 family)
MTTRRSALTSLEASPRVAGRVPEGSRAMSANLLTSADTITDEDVRRFARLWWVPLVLGVGWLVVALAVLQFDIGSVRTISLLFGVILIAAAIHEAADVFLAPGWKWLHATLAALYLVGGVTTLVWPDITFVVLANLIGWYLLFKGTFDVVAALSLRDRLELWGLGLAAGVLELVLAFWAVGYPGRSAALLILWVGLGAVARGVTSIIVAFQIRSIGKESALLLPHQPASTDSSAAARL